MSLLRSRTFVALAFVAMFTMRIAAAGVSHNDGSTVDSDHWWCSICGCTDIDFDPYAHGTVCDYIIGWFWRCTFNELHDCKANGIIVGSEQPLVITNTEQPAAS